MAAAKGRPEAGKNERGMEQGEGEGTVTEQLGIQHHRAAAIQQLGLCPSVAVMGELVPPGLVCPQPGQHACQKKILPTRNGSTAGNS